MNIFNIALTPSSLKITYLVTTIYLWNTWAYFHIRVPVSPTMNARDSEKGHQKFRIRNFLRSYRSLGKRGASGGLAMPLATPGPMAIAGTVQLEVDASPAPASASIACWFLADVRVFWFFVFFFFVAGAGLSCFLFFGAGAGSASGEFKLLLESSSRSLRFAV